MGFHRSNLRSENENSIVDELKGKSGVYRIILCSQATISRLNGEDDSCLLYIGHAKSNNGLLKRIRDFYDSATNTNAKGQPPTTHQAGRFYQLYLKNHFGDALENLQFEFVVTESDEAAVRMECNELESYLEVYAELPPLNNQLPKAI